MFKDLQDKIETGVLADMGISPKRKTQNKASQQTHRDKQKKRKPIVEELITKIKALLKQLDEV